MAEQTAYIMIGVIGSGKSTWSRLQAANSKRTNIVSRDSIREMLNGKYVFDPRLEDLVTTINFSAARDILTAGHNLIVDECHVSKKARKPIVDWIRANFPTVKIVGVYCPSQSGNVDRRMTTPKGGTREKWQMVFESMVERFEKPEPIEFDELITVNEDLK